MPECWGSLSRIHAFLFLVKQRNYVLCVLQLCRLTLKSGHRGRSSLSYLESDPSVNLRQLRVSVVKAVGQFS
jgi:hypothetical protein